MKIRINGHEYDFTVRGTVGLVCMAERMLGEPFKGDDNYHMLVLYYACLKSSNKGRDIDDLSLQDFISSMTSGQITRISEYFWDKWAELEGSAPRDEDPKEDDKGED